MWPYALWAIIGLACVLLVVLLFLMTPTVLAEVVIVRDEWRRLWRYVRLRR